MNQPDQTDITVIQSNQAAITVITSTLAVMAFMCVITICVISFAGQKVPSELNTLTGTLCGALTAMLVKTSPTETVKAMPTPPPMPPPPQPPEPDEPVAVQVVNTPNDPVPTEEAPPKLDSGA